MKSCFLLVEQCGGIINWVVIFSGDFPSGSSTYFLFEVDFCSLIHTQDHQAHFLQLAERNHNKRMQKPTSYFQHCLSLSPSAPARVT